MLGNLIIKFLHITILCYSVQNGQCTDDLKCGTPAPKMTAMPSDPTPGRRVVEDQAKLLKRENFTGLLGEATVDSWGVNWIVFADQELPFDDSKKRNNLRVISDRLRDINLSANPIRSDARFIAMRGSVATLRDDMQAVHAKRLEELTGAYFASELFPLGKARVVRYGSKVTGDQLGGVAIVALPEGQEVKYYIKTHSGGHLSSRSSTAKPVNPIELMVYQIFALSGFGCPAHFFHRSLDDVYIATLDAAIDPRTWRSGSFLTFDQYRTPKSSESRAMAGSFGKLWESLEAIPTPCSDADKLAIEARIAGDPQAQSFLEQIAVLDILSRILRLTDMFNNPDNFGFVMHGEEIPRLKVVDFRVLGAERFSIEREQYTGFLDGNGHFNYAVAHRLLSYALHYRDVNSRCQTVRQILSAAGPLVGLSEIIRRAHAEIVRYLAHPVFAAHREGLMGMLEGYKDAVLYNLGHFSATLNHEDPQHDKTQCFECEHIRKLSEPVKA